MDAHGRGGTQQSAPEDINIVKLVCLVSIINLKINLLQSFQFPEEGRNEKFQISAVLSVCEDKLQQASKQAKYGVSSFLVLPQIVRFVMHARVSILFYFMKEFAHVKTWV